MSVVTAVDEHKKIHVQMKTMASLTAMKGERNAFPLLARIWLVFFRSVNNTKQLMRSGHVFLRMQMQYRASAVDKMKIEPAMNSLMEKIPHHPRWQTKMMVLSRVFFCFLKVPWLTW